MLQNVKHDLNREKVCLLCLQKDTRCKKTTYRKILRNSKLEELINVHFRYNALEKRLPNAVCDGCRRKLYHVENGSQLTINRPDLNQFYTTEIKTRSTNSVSTAPCPCKICQIAGTPLFEKVEEEIPKDRERKIVKPFRGNDKGSICTFFYVCI